MIDATTKQPLRVTTEGGASAYIMLNVEQLDSVRAILDANKVLYWVDEESLTFDGGPETIVINLSYRADPAAVQRLLDSVP
jgi:hypothetical protein